VIDGRTQYRGRVTGRNGSLRRPIDSHGGEAIGKLRLGDATIFVIAVDNGVQAVTRHPAGTASAFQVLDKGGQQAESLAAAAVQREQLGLVSRGAFVLQVSLDTDKAPVALLAPEVGVLNERELLFGVRRLEESRFLDRLVINGGLMTVDQVAVVVAVGIEDLVAHAEDAFVVLISADMLQKFLETRKGQLMVRAVAVACLSLVFHGVD